MWLKNHGLNIPLTANNRDYRSWIDSWIQLWIDSLLYLCSSTNCSTYFSWNNKIICWNNTLFFGPINLKSDRFLYIAFDPLIANNRNRTAKNVAHYNLQLKIDFQDNFCAKLQLIYMGIKPLIRFFAWKRWNNTLFSSYSPIWSWIDSCI